MPRLKADFHTHTSDDPVDDLRHSAEMLIDEAAANDIDVLSITCHYALIFDNYLAEYAAGRGVLLIPGIETGIDDCHVILLNPDKEQLAASTFEDLRRLGKRDAVIIAPHPYYFVGASLGKKLEENIDLFDAVEYSSLYLPGINFFNQYAVHIAKRHGLPMVGTTDTHILPYAPSTFTWVDSEPTMEGVLEAIRQGRVSVESRPRPIVHAANMAGYVFYQAYRNLKNSGQKKSAECD